MKFSFIPLHFSDKLTIINREGSIGIVTLWSEIKWVLSKLEEAGVDLSAMTSPVAVAGNLYGNGLPEFLRNLLYNPQISSIIIMGKNRSGSSEELTGFFMNGLEEVEFLGGKKSRIVGTDRIIDDMVRPEMFNPMPVIYNAGDPSSKEFCGKIKEIFGKIRTPDKGTFLRQEIPLPTILVRQYPSNPRNHNIISDEPLKAWVELIFRLSRFGRLVHLRKGDRQELQNVRVIVEKPSFITGEKLKLFGLDYQKLTDYYNNFLDTELPPDTSYTYGNRIGAYFGGNTLEDCINNLLLDREDRKSYISLWDSSIDTASKSGHPCLVSVYFRTFEDKLTLTAVFRTHNSLDAWLKNFYGLMKVQRTVCEKLRIEPGAITVISHSISIDPRRIDVAKSIAAQKTFEVKEDPNGNFLIEVINGEIVVRQFFQGIQVDEYRGNNPVKLQHEIARNYAVSDINHAIYLGRMLERAYSSLKRGEDFFQR